MSNITPTKEALLLRDCLEARGIEVVLQHWDGHKHVDLYIPKAKLYIEIDGMQHYTNPKQIMSDIERDYWSYQDGFKTFRVPSFVVLTEGRRIAKSIEQLLLLIYSSSERYINENR